MIDHLGTQPIAGAQISCSIAYIYIPKNVDRNKFVETCMRKGVCSIVRDNSFGAINNVKIGVEEIQIVDWPVESGKIGSCVVVVMDQFKKTYNVVSVLNSDGEVLKAKEGVRIIQKETDKGTVTITLDANRPTLQAMVEGGDLEVISRGGAVRVTASREVAVKAPKIAHNKADEPMLRGQKVVTLLEKLIDLVSQAKTSTAIGLQPLTTALQIADLKKDLEELKSTKSYLE